MNCSLEREAEAELAAAIAYYESVRAGLGLKLQREVFSTLEKICAFPRMGTPLAPGIRRALVRRFPFSILYSEEAESIHVLVFAHHRRDPEYWQDRIQKFLLPE